MADCAKAFKFVLSHEDSTPPSGKITQEPGRGQARLGVNSHAFPEALSDGFYSMPLSDALAYAENIFVINFWDAFSGSRFVSQLIADKVADLAVNAGLEEAVLLLQRAANAIYPVNPLLGTDGICGDDTLARVNLICGDDEDGLYAAILAQGEAFYEVLRAKYPDKFPARLEKIWLTRLALRPPVGI